LEKSYRGQGQLAKGSTYSPRQKHAKTDLKQITLIFNLQKAQKLSMTVLSQPQANLKKQGQKENSKKKEKIR
jgi:hypothetical protein